MIKNIYIFSGLGADERVFQKLDFSGFSITYLKWIIPEKKESIKDYVKRLLEQIKSTKPILIGLSFGGIIAIEVAKLIETEKVIIIASAKTRDEIPFYFRIFGKLRLHKLLPINLLKNSNIITNWFFGINSIFDKNLLKQILFDTNPIFLKWAMDIVVNWENKTHIKNLFHIHGTRDRILPFKFVKCNAIIKNGGHLMTLNKFDEINKILKSQLLT